MPPYSDTFHTDTRLPRRPASDYAFDDGKGRKRRGARYVNGRLGDGTRTGVNSPPSAAPPTARSPHASSRTSRPARSRRSRHICTPAVQSNQRPPVPRHPSLCCPTCPSCSVESDSCTVAPVWARVRRAAKFTWRRWGRQGRAIALEQRPMHRPPPHLAVHWRARVREAEGS